MGAAGREAGVHVTNARQRASLLVRLKRFVLKAKWNMTQPPESSGHVGAYPVVRLG